MLCYNHYKIHHTAFKTVEGHDNATVPVFCSAKFSTTKGFSLNVPEYKNKSYSIISIRRIIVFKMLLDKNICADENNRL